MRPRQSEAVLTTALVVLLAAGCGGGSAPPPVAAVGPTTTAAAAPATPGGTPASNLAAADAYAQCMRAHGVGNFPDPQSDGGFLIGGSGSTNPSHSPNFASANKTCQHLLPNDGTPTAAQNQKMEALALRYAECMRAHGVSDFPDPTPNSGINLGGNESLDHNTPQFRAAITACRRSVLSGKGSSP